MTSTQKPGLNGRLTTTSEAAVEATEAAAPARRFSAVRLGGRGWRALRHPNYRLYFFGQVVSQSGTWLQRIAQAWVVLDVANSPAALGVLTIFQFAPALALSLVAGVVADRVGKQRLIMITSTLEALQALAMAAVMFSGNVQLWQIYLLAFLLGLFTTFETPARQAFVSDLVPREDIQSAVALNSSVFNAARIVGPAIGGIILATWGAAWAFALNGVSYLAVLAALAMLDPKKMFSSGRAARGALWSQIGDGLRHAAHAPTLAYPLSLLAVLGMLGYNFGVVLPLMARYSLDVGAVGFGALNAAMGVGSLLGALLITPHLAPGLPDRVARGARLFAVAAGGGTGAELFGDPGVARTRRPDRRCVLDHDQHHAAVGQRRRVSGPHPEPVHLAVHGQHANWRSDHRRPGGSVRDQPYAGARGERVLAGDADRARVSALGAPSEDEGHRAGELRLR